MKKLYLLQKKFQSGVTMVEYGLLITLISLAVVTTITAVSNQINSNYEKICQTLNHNEPCDLSEE